ncbi:hypothetical protein [Streptomyces sp. NPDC048392]|uniref:hypothetical protein n=1 Tax=Streptomyces sp. NPDC048392 TaxID=3365543 RepID=UPI00371071AD
MAPGRVELAERRAVILSSGEPVVSMWGWSGSDRAMTLDRLKELVRKGESHYIQVGDGGMDGGSGVSSEVTQWVQEHGTAVEESEYGTTASSDASASASASASADDSGSQARSTSAVYRLGPADAN